VNEKLQAIEADGGASPEDLRWARLFLAQQIERGVVKRNVMTYSYGSALDGMKKQLMEKFPIREKQALFLARQVRKTIEDTVDLPAKAMGFLQKLMRIVAQQQRPLYWTTPIGFPLINRYHKKEEYHRPRIYIHEHGVGKKESAYKIVLYRDTDAIYKEKAANAISPNFVHACDAAHLMMTVNAAAAEGITNIVTVHDSFGCLAPRAERFRKIIREQFVKMYEEHDVLEEILKQAKQDLGDKLRAGKKWPQLPKRGTLDLKGVLDAEYAFA
jgi:DNA-directed RNA polymerase, mitochondrial